MTARIDFFCRDCDLDFSAKPVKEKNRWVEWWATRCPKCRNKSIRQITNKLKDPYYNLSKRVIIERKKHRKDLIQYGEAGFQTLYPKQWEDMQKAQEEHEGKMKKDKEHKDKLLREFGHDINSREAVLKAFEHEEKWQQSSNNNR